MPTTETVRGLTEPTVGGDTGIWGTELNGTIAALAAILGTTISFPSTTYGTNATVTSSQAQSARLVIGNTLAAGNTFQMNLPSSNFANGNFVITNNSSAGNSCTVTAGSSGTGGTTVSIPSATTRHIFNDGVNIFFADPQPNTGVTSLGATTGAITLNAAGLSISGSTLAVIQTAPTVQSFTAAGSGTYSPTSSSVQRIRVRMCGAGGGGGGPPSNNGSSGTSTVFGAWTALAGGGGPANIVGGGAAGTGGTNGTGTAVMRLAGGAGGVGTALGAGTQDGGGGTGGSNPFGGAGAAGVGNGGAASQNTGGGGGGGGANFANNYGGSGGGAGEYVEFWVTAPSSGGTSYTVGTGGSGGGGSASLGGNGANGLIVVEEFYI